MRTALSSQGVSQRLSGPSRAGNQHRNLKLRSQCPVACSAQSSTHSHSGNITPATSDSTTSCHATQHADQPPTMYSNGVSAPPATRSSTLSLRPLAHQHTKVDRLSSTGTATNLATHHVVTKSHPLPENVQQPLASGQTRRLLLFLGSSLQSRVMASTLLGMSSLTSLLAEPQAAAAAIKAGVTCSGLSGYKLQKCLREKRLAREAEDAAAELNEAAAVSSGASSESSGSSSASAISNSSSTGATEFRPERTRRKLEEQDGNLITLPSGIQYREMEVGKGRPAEYGDVCDISYVVYRLSPGAYFKYSSGATAIFVWSLGYGNEGKDDVGDTYKFRLGDPGSLPAAAPSAIVGMQEGGKRRIFVPPQYGWVTDKTGPRPDTFGGGRRLVTHRIEPLLFEVELRRARGDGSSGSSVGGREVEQLAMSSAYPDAILPTAGGQAFRMPLPLSTTGQRMRDPKTN